MRTNSLPAPSSVPLLITRSALSVKILPFPPPVPSNSSVGLQPINCIEALPEAGEIVTPDEIITIIYSLGIAIEVPEVEGLNYQDAIDKLEEFGLVATVNGDTNGIVRKQIPRKGEFIEPEGVIELTFDE